MSGLLAGCQYLGKIYYRGDRGIIFISFINESIE